MNEQYIPTEEETMLILQKQREETASKVMEKINTIPIDDVNKKKLVDMYMCFYDQRHSGFSANYALSNIFYFLYNNNTLEDIEYTLYTKYIDACKNSTDDENELDIQRFDIQRLMTDNVKEMVTKIKDILNDNMQYKDFYISFIRKLLYKKPLHDYITFEDDKWEMWEDSEKELGNLWYFHKDTSQIIKIVDPKTKETHIYQQDYYIFEDKMGDMYTCDESSLDITDCYSWSIDSVDIDIDTVQMFVKHYNQKGVLFDQTEYNGVEEDSDAPVEDE